MNSVGGVLNRHCGHEHHPGQNRRPCITVRKRPQANREACARDQQHELEGQHRLENWPVAAGKIETDEPSDDDNDADHR
jgi:hypothetical protein